MAQTAPDVNREIQQAKEARKWFFDLVSSQEELANRDPVAYKRKVRMLGLLGYFYIFGVLALVILLLAGVVWLMVASRSGNYLGGKFVIILLVLAWGISRSLFVRIRPPEGIVLSRSEAPQLYAAVDAIADRLKAPRPDEIRINEELNAAAVQIPRLGVFGWYRNTLLLGMPLLLALRPEEARAVIAHEFGHFSGAHGKFGASAYRLNRTWEQLQENLAEQGSSSWMFGPFFNWFSPRYAATSFALRRANEYEADNAAASVAGAENIARSLMRFPYLGEHLDKAFWTPFYEQAKHAAALPQNAFVQMSAAVRTEDRQTIHKHIVSALDEKTDYLDTHPSLSDRLKSLGISVEDVDVTVEELVQPVQPNAAEVLFGASLPHVLAKLEAAFAERVGPAWQVAHQNFQEQFGELNALEQKADRTEQETAQHALLVYKLRPTSEALPTIRAAHDLYPENALVCMVLAEALFENLDPQAPELFEKAARLDSDYRDVVRERLAAYHYRTGAEDRATALQEEAFEEAIKEDLDRRAASELRLKDELLLHDLSAEEVVRIVQQLRTVERLQVAYLVRRQLPATGRHCYYLMVFHKKKTLESDSEPQKIVNAVAEAVDLPSRTLILSPNYRKDWMVRLEGMPNARIFGSPD
jgi:Zn-dependent protease with chaperone function